MLEEKQGSSISINPALVVPYLLLLVLMYLKCVYFPGPHIVLFWALVVLPALSALELFIASHGLRYNQHFSTEHPSKGDRVVYKLVLQSESLLPVPGLEAIFKQVRLHLREERKDLRFFFRGKSEHVHEQIIECPYRGVYTAGLERLVIRDFLRIFAVRLPVWHRTFYVYPRILPLDFRYETEYESRETLSLAAAQSGPSSQTFRSLEEYRPGLPVSRISWRKFALYGNPFVLSYDGAANPGVSLVMDTRPDPTERYLETEDISVETLVSLVQFFLNKEVPVGVKIHGGPEYGLVDRSFFPEFHKLTLTFQFQDPAASGINSASPTLPLAPHEVFLADRAAGRISGNLVIFITHRLDPELLGLADPRRDYGSEIVVLLILNSMDDAEKRRTREYARTMTETGGRVLLIQSAATIAEDLLEQTR